MAKGNGNLKRHEVLSRWWIGDIVYRKIDTSGLAGLIIGVGILPEGHVTYRAVFDDENNHFYEMELEDSPVYNFGKEDQGHNETETAER